MNSETITERMIVTTTLIDTVIWKGSDATAIARDLEEVLSRPGVVARITIETSRDIGDNPLAGEELAETVARHAFANEEE